MARYHLVRIDGRIEGPFSSAQIQELCRSGLCHADEHIFDAEAGNPESTKQVSEIPQLQGLLPGGASTNASGTPLSAADVARTVRPAVVQIRTPTGTGTGFSIDPHGTILTNLHVVSNSTKCEVHFENGSIVPGRVVFRSNRADLAVIASPMPSPNFICLSRCRGDSPVLGDKAVALGFPQDHGFNVTEGLISATSVKIPERVAPEYSSHHWVRISAQINGGNSGGPILDSQGRLIGMATWSTVRDSGGARVEGMNYGLPHDVICSELREFRRRVRSRELHIPTAEELVRDSHRPDPLEELDLAISIVCSEFGFRVIDKQPIPGSAHGFTKARLASALGDILEIFVDTFGFGEDGPPYLTMYCPIGELPAEGPRADFEGLLKLNLTFPHWNLMLHERSLKLRCSRQLDLVDAVEIRGIVEDLTIILNRLVKD
jgi:S1-C subfamily serine protease